MAISANLATLTGYRSESQTISRLPSWMYFDVEQPAVIAGSAHSLTKLFDVPDGFVCGQIYLACLKINTTGTSTIKLQTIDTDDSPVITDMIAAGLASTLTTKTDANTLQSPAANALWATVTGYVMPVLATGALATAAMYLRMDQTTSSTVGAIWRIGILGWRVRE